MKKVIFALAIAGMFGFAACSSNTENTDSTADTTAVEVAAPAVEEIADTTAVEAVAEEVVEEVVAE